VFVVGCDLEDLSIFPLCVFPFLLILRKDTQIDPCKDIIRVDMKGPLQLEDGFFISFPITIEKSKETT
jgi:hypothetical protein